MSDIDPLRLLTVNQLADLLAISRDSVYRLVRAGKLPSILVGDRIRFRAVDVDDYLRRNTQRNTQPVNGDDS